MLIATSKQTQQCYTRFIMCGICAHTRAPPPHPVRRRWRGWEDKTKRTQNGRGRVQHLLHLVTLPMRIWNVTCTLTYMYACRPPLSCDQMTRCVGTGNHTHTHMHGGLARGVCTLTGQISFCSPAEFPYGVSLNLCWFFPCVGLTEMERSNNACILTVLSCCW